MVDHYSRKVDWSLPVYQVSETLIHYICQISSLTPENDVLDNKPKDQLVVAVLSFGPISAAMPFLA